MPPWPSRATMRYRSASSLPGENRPWSTPEEDDSPEDPELLCGRFEGGRAGATTAIVPGESRKLVGWSVSATGVAQLGQNRASSGTGRLHAVQTVTGGL
jgi:hypothetical protein